MAWRFYGRNGRNGQNIKTKESSTITSTITITITSTRICFRAVSNRLIFLHAFAFGTYQEFVGFGEERGDAGAVGGTLEAVAEIDFG